MIVGNGHCELVLNLDDTNEADWLAERLTGLTGTDCLAALGLDPYKSRLALWHAKRDPQPVEENARMRMGKRLESVVREEFAYQTGLSVEPANVLLRSVHHPFMLASPDGWVVENGHIGIFEAKTTTVWNRGDWADDQVPLRALAQVAHYLAVTGLDFAYVAVLIDNEVLYRKVERDSDLVADIVQREADFWQLVVDGEMPAVDYHESTTDALKAMWPEPEAGKTVDLDATLIEVVGEWRTAKAEIELLKSRRDALANRIREAMTDAEVAMAGDRPVLSYKASEVRRVDTPALRAAHPGIVEEFTVVSTQRTLRELNRKKGGE